MKSVGEAFYFPQNMTHNNNKLIDEDIKQFPQLPKGNIGIIDKETPLTQTVTSLQPLLDAA